MLCCSYATVVGWRRNVLGALLIVVVGVVAYGGTLSVPFVMDDAPNIVANPLITSLQDALFPGRYCASPALDALQRHTCHFFRSRHVVSLTFAANYAVHGLAVPGFHSVNIVVHLLSALVLWRLVLLLFRSPLVAEKDDAEATALLTALLFVSHPLQTQAVTYVVQRHTLMAALFCLVALSLYARARCSPSARASAVQYLGALVATAVAMRCKENAVALPLVLLAYEAVFHRGSASRIFLVLPFALLVTWLFLRAQVAGVAGLGAATRLETDMSRADYLFTELPVILLYLRLLAWPVGQSIDHDVPLRHAFSDPVSLAAAASLVVLIAVAVRLARDARRGVRTSLALVSFGILTFLLALAPESSIFPITDVVFEHRVYLPSAGAFLAVSVLAWRGVRALNARAARVAIAAQGVIVVALVVATVFRNQVWQSPVTLWEDAAATSPRKARVHINLGSAYAEAGEPRRAMAAWQTAVALDPASAPAHYNLGNAYQDAGNMARAEDEWRAAVSANPRMAAARFNLGCAYRARGETLRAEVELRAAVDARPMHAKAWAMLGDIDVDNGRLARAVEEYARADALLPDNARIPCNLAVALEGLRDFGGAVRQYERCLARVGPGENAVADDVRQRLARVRERAATP